MDIFEASAILREQFADRDWFVDIGIIDKKPQHLIVYTKRQSFDILSEIPAKIAGYQILVHFASSMPPKAMESSTVVSEPEIELEPITAIESVPPRELDINVLIRELDRIEKFCGSNTLQDIFYEIHDQKNAVTNLSSRYPEVREPLERLYNTYGFDVIYEEIDG